MPVQQMFMLNMIFRKYTNLTCTQRSPNLYMPSYWRHTAEAVKHDGKRWMLRGTYWSNSSTLIPVAARSAL
jgi:hypothetical protein